MNFEKIIQQLETLTEAIESPKTQLDEALALYKEGIALAKQGGKTLTQYEAEVTRLQKDAEGIFTLSPFNSEAKND